MLSASVWRFVCERLISCPIFSGGNPCRRELRKTVQESMCTKTACVAKEKEKAAPRGPSCIITYYSFHIYSLVVLYFFFRRGAFYCSSSLDPTPTVFAPAHCVVEPSQLCVFVAPVLLFQTHWFTFSAAHNSTRSGNKWGENEHETA